MAPSAPLAAPAVPNIFVHQDIVDLIAAQIPFLDSTWNRDYTSGWSQYLQELQRFSRINRCCMISAFREVHKTCIFGLVDPRLIQDWPPRMEPQPMMHRTVMQRSQVMPTQLLCRHLSLNLYHPWPIVACEIAIASEQEHALIQQSCTELTSWYTRILMGFRRLRSLRVSIQASTRASSAGLWFNLVARANLPLVCFEIELIFHPGTNIDAIYGDMSVELSSFEVQRMFKKLRNFGWKGIGYMIGQGPGLGSSSWLIENVTRLLSCATMLDQLTITEWKVEVPQWGLGADFPSPPISSCFCSLVSLELVDVHLSASSLADIMDHCCNTIKYLMLQEITLTSGYWSDVIEKALACGLAHHLITGTSRLVYGKGTRSLPRSPSMPEEQVQDKYVEHVWGFRKPDDYGALLTLRSGDRKAWKKMCDEVGHPAPGSREDKDFDHKRFRGRCAGAAQDMRRCLNGSMTLQRRRDSKLWWNDRLKTPFEEVYLCRWHRWQRALLEHWPWERPRVAQFQSI